MVIVQMTMLRKNSHEKKPRNAGLKHYCIRVLIVYKSCTLIASQGKVFIVLVHMKVTSEIVLDDIIQTL